MTHCERCEAPRWNRTRLCRAHYYRDYRKRKKGSYDTNAARKMRRFRKRDTTDHTPRCATCSRVLEVEVVSGGWTRLQPCHRCTPRR